MQNAQRKGSNNNNNNIIISGNAVNNDISQHNNNKSQNDIVRNRNSFANEVLHNEMSIRQEPDHVLNDQNNDSRTIMEDPARHERHESNDRSYKPYSKSYTNFRKEPVMTRSATRAEAQRRLETIVEKEENEGVSLRSILKEDIRTSTPAKKNKSVSFNLPYSPIRIPSLMSETVVSPNKSKSEKPVMRKLTAKYLYIPPFRRNEKNQANNTHRLDTQEVTNLRRTLCSDRELNALIDIDAQIRNRHNVSLTPRSTTAETIVTDNKFIVKFPKF